MTETENKKKLLIEGFARTIKNVFPRLGWWLKFIAEPRCIGKVKYHRTIMFWTAIFVFLLQLKSSRNINYRLNKSSTFIENFKTLFSLLKVETYEPFERFPDYGTLNDMLKKLSYSYLEKVQVKMVKWMINKRMLEKFRLMGQYYLVAIDGTQFLIFEERHCPHCLRKETGKDEEGNPIYSYYHYVLSAKLVTPGPNALAIPIVSEFVENESEDFDKQDCELKAFYRLMPRLKSYFPRIQICLLLDSLYAGEPVFNLIDKCNWQYMIRFKKGSMPAFYKEYLEYLPLYEENRAEAVIPQNHVKQEFQWVNQMEYQGHMLNVLECHETPRTGLKSKSKKKKNNTQKKKTGKRGSQFLWISSIPINHQNYKQLSNEGGRCRWKIENQGFKAQKREGYELEHAYSFDYNAIKCFYSFLQIAHTINQIIERGGMIKDISATFGSKQNYYQMFYTAFTEYTIDKQFVDTIIYATFQIRLDTS